MSSPNLLEKLDLRDDKNILIQGLPNSIERQFSKVSYAKNITPLLIRRKLDFALVFAVNHSQLNLILKEISPALQEKTKLWVAYPKSTSKITSDLNRPNGTWDSLTSIGYSPVSHEEIDNIWETKRFSKGTADDERMDNNGLTNAIMVEDAVHAEVEETVVADELA